MRDIGKKRCGFIHFAGLGVGIREQSRGAPVIEFAVAGYNALEIGNGRREIVEPQRGLRSMIERVRRIVSRADRAMEGVARFGKFLFFKVQLAELLVISGGRIIDDLRFQ